MPTVKPGSVIATGKRVSLLRKLSARSHPPLMGGTKGCAQRVRLVLALGANLSDCRRLLRALR